jgi:pSer/pThr/pTyr-binding forkhead associated (FHA) protein
MEGFDRNIYPLGKATLLVGRRGEADIQLPCDSVSREHASIVVENEQFVLRDNGSANGSFVNGVKTNRSILNHLDIVRFGNYVFLVNFQDGITEKSNYPRRQEVHIDVPKPKDAKPTIATSGISLKLTEPVSMKDDDKSHVKMMLDTL